MRVLYVNSGSSTFHAAIDSYIYATLQKMDCETQQFDLRGHIKYFDQGMQSIKKAHGIDYDGSTLARFAGAPLLYEVNEFQPDLVLVLHGAFLPWKLVQAARNLGAATALWVVDDPYELDNALIYASSYDFVFTVDSSAIPIYERHGLSNVFHLPLAAYPPVHRKKTVQPRYQSDVCFIGSGFYNRLNLLDEIADYLSGLNLKIIGQWWEKLQSFPKLERFIISDTIAPGEAACYYAGAKINLNLHRASDAAAYFEGNKLNVKAASPNNRTFEIAGCGGFQIVDNVRAELNKYYAPGKEIEVFEDPADLRKKIEHYLKHAEERERMASSAQERTYREHSFRMRLESLLNTVEEVLGKKRTYDLGTARRNIRREAHDDYWQVNKLLVKMIPKDARKILDVGCGSGSFGMSLKENGIEEVVGLESSPELAKEAEQKLDQVIVGDLETISPPCPEGQFDCIIYRDSLQSLKEPWRVLSRHRKLLKEGGSLLGCFHNITYYPVIKNLLSGRWKYEDEGVLDRKHLRFFTLEEAVRMLDNAGYEVSDVTGCAYEEIDEEELKRFTDFLRPLDLLPENFQSMSGFAQFVFVAKERKEQTVGGRAQTQ
jgi:spore maturation protein CgeB